MRKTFDSGGFLQFNLDWIQVESMKFGSADSGQLGMNALACQWPNGALVALHWFVGFQAILSYLDTSGVWSSTDYAS